MYFQSSPNTIALSMNSIEELRDYVIADMIGQIGSMSREELVQAMITLCTSSLEQMDANELLVFRREYVERWIQSENMED